MARTLEAKATTKIRPVSHYVLIRPIVNDMTESRLLYIPETAHDRQRGLGEVIACGPGMVNWKTGQREAMEVKPGERVIYSKWSGMEIVEDDTKYRLVPMTEIWAKTE